MYSLVKYSDDIYSVILSKGIIKRNKEDCTVTYRGAKYSASYIAANDDKSILLDRKRDIEEKQKHASATPHVETILKTKVRTDRNATFLPEVLAINKAGVQVKTNKKEKTCKRTHRTSRSHFLPENIKSLGKKQTPILQNFKETISCINSPSSVPADVQENFEEISSVWTGLNREKVQTARSTTSLPEALAKNEAAVHVKTSKKENICKRTHRPSQSHFLPENKKTLGKKQTPFLQNFKENISCTTSPSSVPADVQENFEEISSVWTELNREKVQTVRSTTSLPEALAKNEAAVHVKTNKKENICKETHRTSQSHFLPENKKALGEIQTPFLQNFKENISCITSPSSVPTDVQQNFEEVSSQWTESSKDSNFTEKVQTVKTTSLAEALAKNEAVVHVKTNKKENICKRTHGTSQSHFLSENKESLGVKQTPFLKNCKENISPSSVPADDQENFEGNVAIWTDSSNLHLYYDRAAEETLDIEFSLPSNFENCNKNIISTTEPSLTSPTSLLQLSTATLFNASSANCTLLSSFLTNEKQNSTEISNSITEEQNSIQQLQKKTEINSSFLADTTHSEYDPNNTTLEDYSEIQNEHQPKSRNSEVQNEDVVINKPLNVSKVVVPHRTKKSKQHFCVFCKTLQCKLARHLFLKHKNEKEIKLASNFPIKSKERLQIITNLRKKGDFLHNTSGELNTGILIVSRQQQKHSKKDALDYVCCKYCKAFFSKASLRNHQPKCSQHQKNSRSNVIAGRRLTQYILPIANDVVKTKIFPVLRDDAITKTIRYDELLIKMCNKFSYKYTEHQHDMIRAYLRVLGRFKIEINKIHPEISQLKDIFKPQLFDDCIVALRKTAGWDNENVWFKKPAVAQNLTTLIKKCGNKQRTELIKCQADDLKKDLDDFMCLWEEEIPNTINKKALEDQTNLKRNKKVVLPSTEDIKKLYIFLKSTCTDCVEKLSNGFEYNAWIELVKASLVFIMIFNRRRAGEIERLTLNNYKNKEVVTNSLEQGLLENASEETIALAKKYVRIPLRGKLGRTVSVLLCPLCVRAIDLIIKYRSEAGITNDNVFIFVCPGGNRDAKKYQRACPLLRTFSLSCGANMPETLRGTYLRKHIATYTAMLKTGEESVDQLAQFLGHHKDIHKSIYRVPLPVTEITSVSKLLMAAIGGDDDDENEVEEDIENRRLDDPVETNATTDEKGNDGDSESENWDSADDINKNDEQNNSSTSKKRRSTSPYGKTKRVRWCTEEIKAVTDAFGDLAALEKIPSLAECVKAIGTYPALKKRTPPQLKSYIDNQIRYKIGNRRH